MDWQRKRYRNGSLRCLRLVCLHWRGLGSSIFIHGVWNYNRRCLRGSIAVWSRDWSERGFWGSIAILFRLSHRTRRWYIVL